MRGALRLPARPNRVDALVEATRQESPDGLWLLDETSGTRAWDRSGKNNHGTYVGGCTLNYERQLGRSAVKLDGASGRVEIPSSVDPGDVFSMGAWMRRVDGTTYITMFSKAKPGVAWRVSPAEQMELVKSQTAVSYTSPAFAEDTRWHYYGVTKSGATAHMFLDGVELSPLGGANQTMVATALVLSIGCDRTDTNVPNTFSNAVHGLCWVKAGVVVPPARFLAHYRAGVGH